MPITTGFNHVATLTANMDRLVGFYADVFGSEVIHEVHPSEGHPHLVIIDLGGGAALNVFAVPAETILGEQRTIGGRGAIDHFGLAVSDLATLEMVRDRLTAANADVGEIQMLGSEWSLFFRDPDGMELEVCAPSGPST